MASLGLSLGLPEQPDLCTVQADTRGPGNRDGRGRPSGGLAAGRQRRLKSGDRRARPYAEKDACRGPTEPAEKPLTTAAKKEHPKCPWGMLPWLGHL